ncbi:hypothetical protein HBA54_12310 [Pelagibius litoralis]|uniref:Transposase n=1 Tax=Pelagibius litoralis TaxID=374515 RepID=A0A967KBY1_9PROT|nr:hypothetical protein [Pelagibius litoralis]
MLDLLVRCRRCARSTRRLLRKRLKKQGFAPKRVTTGKLKSYAVAIHKAALCRWYRQSVDVLGDEIWMNFLDTCQSSDWYYKRVQASVVAAS